MCNMRCLRMFNLNYFSWMMLDVGLCVARFGTDHEASFAIRHYFIALPAMQQLGGHWSRMVKA